jgi:hypothetical protein
MAKLAKHAYPLYQRQGYSREDFAKEAAALDELQARSDALPEGEVVGALLRFPRADGYAFYVVTKDKPLTMAHVPFGDAWQVEPALIRGLVRGDVIEYLRRQRSWKSLTSAPNRNIIIPS